MNPKPVQTTVEPAVTPEEAAAISAALARFAADTASAAPHQATQQSAWQRAALAEGVTRAAAWE